MIKCISGIQQIGIGNPNVHEAFKWYRQNFGMDIKVFEEAAEANLMLPYTGGKPQKRHAILALNMKGGGGFEIWQYTSRVPQPPAFEIQLGDLGLFAACIKSVDVKGTYSFLKSKGVNILNEPMKQPNGALSFFVKDLYGNIFQIIENDSWFGNGKQLTGGVAGAVIGVSDMERSKKFYAELLGYDKVVYDEEGIFDDLKSLSSGNKKVRRILLRHSKPRSGPFSKLMGNTSIELIKNYEHTPRKIFENRFWGDLGFIHLSFDVTSMAEVKRECENFGHPFTVDSASSFDMGEAAGHFSYIEDPDGYWIEFVETHKVPILKKLGLYLNLRKRNPNKALPDIIVKALALGRVND